MGLERQGKKDSLRNGKRSWVDMRLFGNFLLKKTKTPKKQEGGYGTWMSCSSKSFVYCVSNTERFSMDVQETLDVIIVI